MNETAPETTPEESKAEDQPAESQLPDAQKPSPKKPSPTGQKWFAVGVRSTGVRILEARNAKELNQQIKQDPELDVIEIIRGRRYQFKVQRHFIFSTHGGES